MHNDVMLGGAAGSVRLSFKFLCLKCMCASIYARMTKIDMLIIHTCVEVYACTMQWLSQELYAKMLNVNVAEREAAFNFNLFEFADRQLTYYPE